MSSDDFRSRSLAVRQAARAHLAEIRAARVERLRRSAPPSRPHEPSAPVVRAASGLRPGAQAAALAALAQERSADVAAAASEPVRPDAAEQPAASAPAASPPLGLAGLPGAGPGLLWILERSGISSLADLAACDPIDLRARVGFLGALVNVDAWIAFAREQTAAGG